MPRRRRHGVIAALALAGTGLGCQADLGTAGCVITKQATLAASPLTLSQEARLDAVGSDYVLMGLYGGAVRWASLTADGVLGGEHAFGLPADISSPPLLPVVVFATASSSSTSLGDTVLVGWLAPDSTGTKLDLSMIALPADGSPPTGPAAVIHEFPGGTPDGKTVAMVSSRKGMNAGLAWEDPVTGQVQLVAVDYTGAQVGTPTPTAPVSAPFDCLGFQSGKDDLTLVYHGKFTSTSGSGWVIAEANDAGGVDSYTSLGVGSYTSCVRVAPAAAGYAFAWQDSTGGELSVLVAGSNTQPVTWPFAPSSGFGGADLQPPIAALAPFQQDFGVLFQRAKDAELWRIDQMANRRSGALIFPSVQGDMGTVSTVLETKDGMLAPSGALVATYADYPVPLPPDGGTPQTGDRVFLSAACH